MKFFSIGSLLLSFFFFFRLLSTETAPDYLFHDCPNTDLFIPSSTYQYNLDTLLSTLSSAATNSTDGFSNATAGQSPPDRAYGLFLCLGDLDTTSCSHCVSTAKKDILERCPSQRVTAIWDDRCMLRYSNRSTFSAMERSPNLIPYETGNITDSIRFVQLLRETLNSVATRASAGRSGKKVAVAEANFTSSQKLYALAQCTPDLATPDCVMCLQIMIANLPKGNQGGRLLTPSCNVRYELYPFYNASALLLPAPPPPASAPPPPALMTGPKAKWNKSIVIIILVVPTVSFLFLAWRFSRRNMTMTQAVVQGDRSGQPEVTNCEPLQYNLDTIRTATDNFSCQNKLGCGGFGVVYKGKLPHGKLIAVKRLSPDSKQGAEEFNIEGTLLPKLRHPNIVRLLGSCSEGQEKLLVYEFLPEKSLSDILFDVGRSKLLDWSIRYKIACGIAQGILYLHESSQPRIIHRDLKLSNILLDNEMNPKISDFGMAKILEDDQTHANTSRNGGTWGYMSFEYCTHGQFSMKSDVYSFGVLLLELISGRKTRSFNEEYEGEGIARYAWENWRNGTPLAVLDPVIGDSYSRDEVRKCLKIGILCAQKDRNDRPTMADIVLELESHLENLEEPQRLVSFFSSPERPVTEIEAHQSTDSSITTQDHSHFNVNPNSIQSSLYNTQHWNNICTSFLPHYQQTKTMTKKKVVVKVSYMNGRNQKCWIFPNFRRKDKCLKALQIAKAIPGFQSLILKGADQDVIEVTGVGVDAVELTNKLRKKVGYATLETVDEEKRRAQEDEQPPPPALVAYPSYPSYIITEPEPTCVLS